MSEFLKKLEEIYRGKARSIGFGAAAKSKAPALMMVGCLTSLDEEPPQIAISSKVDALLYDIKDGAGQAYTIAKLAKNDDKIPWGVRVQKAGPEGINRLAEAGCDFVVLDDDSLAQVLQEEKMDKVLEVDPSLKDGSLRAIGQLPVDALFIAEDKHSGSLTINQLLNYHRVTGFAGKYSLASLPKELSDLGALRDSGIKGIVMEVSGKDIEARIKEVQESIRKLPTTKSRKSKGEGFALLPTTGEVEEIESEY
ncbi:MAG: hypothetical protein R6U37_00690 [Dehalococcoidia bacterium]